jgi:hypothetical protein
MGLLTSLERGGIPSPHLFWDTTQSDMTEWLGAPSDFRREGAAVACAR